jgi:hypothetical protein
MSTELGASAYGRFDELAEEFVQRYRRGERPSVEEYVDRLPEMADAIREMFPSLVQVEQVEAETRDDALAPPVCAVPQVREIGGYRVVREIGRGGMGVVYEAEQISLGRRVALKVLPLHVSSDRMIRERFRREARAAGRMHHTNIVPVYEVGQDGEVRYYAMQLIQGQGLDAVIAELRQLRARDRSRPQSKNRALLLGRSRLPRGVPSLPSTADLGRGEKIEVSAVLKSILAGRFDPGGLSPARAEDSQSATASNSADSATTVPDTGMERRAAEDDPAEMSTAVDSALAHDMQGSSRAHPPALSDSTEEGKCGPAAPGWLGAAEMA